MRLNLRKDRGDTIIEVLFAVTVFALVAVGSLAIMNQGTAAAQRALEITLVRQQIDAQAQAIRYIHQAYIAGYQQGGAALSDTAAQWKKMTDKTQLGADNASPFGANVGSTCPQTIPAQKPFLLNARKATVWAGTPSTSPPPGGSLPPFAQVIYNDDSSIGTTFGLWVEAVPSDNAEPNTPGFVDFHIRACWDSAGSPVPSTLGTIVRLYEPR